MRQHHAKVHGQSLPNRECNDCGSEFYDSKAQREFCDECNPNAGEHNGNWKDATEISECVRCGNRFEFYPSNKRGVYCSTCVEDADEFLGDHYADVHDIEWVERECDYCGKKLTVLASERKYGAGRFCSRECLYHWMSENRRGENHHQWLSGEREYAGIWWKARRKVLQRDNYQCQYCGKTAEQIGRNPDVHHIRPLRTFQEPQNAHTLDNLISLCRRCHRKAEADAISISRLDSKRKEQ